MRIGIIGATGLVGSQLVAQAHQRGVETAAVARSLGHDLSSCDERDAPAGRAGRDRLSEVIAGCASVINVLQCPDLDEGVATAYFDKTTRRLGAACSTAGVRRIVLLSIIGIDQATSSPDADPGPATPEGYYRAKHVQEQLTRASASDVHVVRSAPFHNFVGQVLGRAAESVSALVSDMPVQPVELSAVADLLLDVATSRRDEPLLEIAGPRVEGLVDLAHEFADYYFDDQQIRPVPASKALADGLLIPHENAIIAGRSFHEWLHTHARG